MNSREVSKTADADVAGWTFGLRKPNPDQRQVCLSIGTMFALGCRGFQEVEMKTGEDVRESGLYSSDCCEQELLFVENDSFPRCPRCSRLCEWELVGERSAA